MQQEFEENKQNELSNSKNMDDLFPEAHSVNSDVYHSTIQMGFPNNNLKTPQIKEELKAGSILKSNIGENNTFIAQEQLNEPSHTCADFVCLIISILICLVAMIVFIVVLTKGSINELQSADVDGNICGESSLENYPYLFMLTEEVVEGVCVISCPNVNYTSIMFFNSSQENQTNSNIYDTVAYGNPRLCIPTNETTLNAMFSNLDYNYMNLFVDEINSSLSFFSLMMLFTLLLLIIFNLIFRILKRFTIYFLITLSPLSLLAAGVCSIIYSANSEKDNYEEQALYNFDSVLHFSTGYLILGILILCYFGFYILQIIWYCKNGDISKLALLIKSAKDINKFYKGLWLIGALSFVIASLYFAFICLFYIYLVPLYSTPVFSFGNVSVSELEDPIAFNIIAFCTIPIVLWAFACLISFSQFCLAVVNIAKYFPITNVSLNDNGMKIFSNKLNYHIGSIFFAGLGIIILFFARITLGFLIALGNVLSSFSPQMSSWSCFQRFYKSIFEKFSGNAFIIIALSNKNFIESSNIVKDLLNKNYDTYRFEGDIGEIMSHSCGIIVFCLNILVGIAFGLGKVEIEFTFFPLFIYALFGYYGAILLTQNYWYQISVMYILFCIREEVFGKREENQYYENKLFHSKLNEIGGIYSIIRASKEESSDQKYSHFKE